MMISPAGYVRIHENDSFEQLIKERELLIDSIKRLEEIVFKDINKESQEWGICPSPDVQYQCNLEYLAELCNFMSQKYNREVVWESDIEENEATESAIKIRKEGITKLNVDAIVNAANDGLWEGGGVCGAIFREAGSVELTKACKAIGGCKTGNAVITPGFKLPAKYIIHAVGPVWHGGKQNEPKLLYSAYKQSLILAKENDCHSIGFPLISDGIFGYPKEQAWRKAIQACKDFINDNSDYDIEIYFAVLDDEIKQIGEQVLEELS